MNRNLVMFPLFIALLLLASLVCAIPGAGPDAPAATPTPPGDTMIFTIPAYTYSLAPGESVPGTGLTFVERSGDSFQVSIDGQTALKRPGDSFYWNGVLAPGVYANYYLRLTTSIFGSMPVAGPVEIIILNPEPVAELGVPDSAGKYRFANIVVDYIVPVGYQIPGTTLTFAGVEERGQGGQMTNFARITGATGYPSLALGDSLLWTGRLRDNVYLAYSFRITSLTAQNIRLTGTAELWIVPL